MAFSYRSALAASLAALPAFGRVGAARADDTQGAASSRMSYSRFLEYLDMGRVKKVCHLNPSDLLCTTSSSSMHLARYSWVC